MLVVDKFRPINKWTERSMVALGAVLGMWALVVTEILSLVIVLALSLIIGGIAALEISMFYRMYFPSGVPESQVSAIISPDYYGSVAVQHFTLFAKVLALCFLIGTIRLIIWGMRN